MKLNAKKELAKRTFGVSLKRIVFVESRLEDIKEAITKQDMRDLKEDGAIIIKEVKGRRKVQKARNRSIGNVRVKVKKGKRKYMTLTRKLRKYVSELKRKNSLTREEAGELRKRIRNKAFRSLANLKEHIREMEK